MNLADILEKDWQKQVRELAAALGYRRAYHTFDSRRSDIGFPDLVLVKDRVVFLELKREKGSVSAAQVAWIEALIAAGAEAYIARPRHLQALAAVLGPRNTSAYRAGFDELKKELVESLFIKQAA